MTIFITGFIGGNIQVTCWRAGKTQVRRAFGTGMANCDSSDIKFDGQGGRCKVCDVVFTSPANGLQHQTGKKHQKRCKQLKVEQSSPKVKISPLGGYVLPTHPDGSSTQQVATDNSIRANEPSSNVAKLILGDSSKYQLPQMPRSKGATLSANVNSCQSQSAVMGCKPTIVQYHGQLWYKCPICLKRLNTATQLEIHMGSHPKSMDVTNCIRESPASTRASRATSGEESASDRVQRLHDQCGRRNASARESWETFRASNIDDVVIVPKGIKLADLKRQI